MAGFGYDDGETGWLENKGGWRFELHTLLRLSGTINTAIADINNDGRPDIVALVSQEWEEIWAFVNEGRGRFTPRMIWGSTNPDFGSSWLSLADMDRDGDVDLVYSNGDAFDYAPSNSRPWHGVQWLENKGQLQFDFHRIADLSGASGPQAADLDGDGDLDVVVASANNDWDNPTAPSLVWLENNGRMQFTKHTIASSPTHLITLAVGDLDGNGIPDIVAGGMHINRPYSRMGRDDCLDESWAGGAALTPTARLSASAVATRPRGRSSPDAAGWPSVAAAVAAVLLAFGPRIRRTFAARDLPRLPELSSQPSAVGEHLREAFSTAEANAGDAAAVGSYCLALHADLFLAEAQRCLRAGRGTRAVGVDVELLPRPDPERTRRR